MRRTKISNEPVNLGQGLSIRDSSLPGIRLQHTMKPLIFRLFCLALSAARLSAAPALPSLFSDHMVLQQGSDVPVWGWADPGEKITVSIRDLSRQTTAGAEGRWRITLPALAAGGPFRLTIAGNRTLTLRDVMVGEVWICSGQSNMAFALGGTATAAVDVPDANYPEIRLFKVHPRSALEPLQTTPGAVWTISSPETARGFSAVGYLFARKLHKELGIPIGMVQSAWGGTTAESWTSPAALRSTADLAPIIRRWDELDAQSKELAAGSKPFDLTFDNFELLRAIGGVESLHPLWSYNWDQARNSMFELIAAPLVRSGLAVRTSGAMEPDEAPVLSAAFRPHRQVRDLSDFMGLRFYSRGNGAFKLTFQQPSGQDSDDYGTGIFEATPDWQAINVRFADLKQSGWGVKRLLTPEALNGFRLQPLRSGDPAGQPAASLSPGSLYNGMIAPLAPFAIRGALWYQGEGNAGRALQYRSLLPVLIRSWRALWNHGDFPFLIVQLPDFGAPAEEPRDSSWAELREAQLLTLKVPNTGLAVTVGLGEAGNVHPKRKTEVAERLALWALGTTYGKDVVYSGPLYDSVSVEGNSMRVHFRYAGRGLQALGGTVLKGFAVAGANRKFYWADSRIEGRSVVVWSPRIPAPAAIRYAWSGSPDCNLANAEGLPASPFRTDDWPGVSGGLSEIRTSPRDARALPDAGPVK